MLSDIQIAQANTMSPISEVAKKIGIGEDALELYGSYKAKLTMPELRSLQKKVASGKKGKLVLVTAITPTPAGEGKSTVSIGLRTDFVKSGKIR